MPASMNLPRVYDLHTLSLEMPALKKQNTQALLATPEFQRLLDRHLPGYDLLTYKAVKVPSALANRKFLMVDEAVTSKYENKAYFRQKFHRDITFPAFEIVKRAELDPSQECFEKIMGNKVAKVIQDERLSGGKGTFIINDSKSYADALNVLDAISSSEQIVISDIVKDPKERSIQACVTDNVVFTGPLQRQIVSHPLLANNQAVGSDKFCGAQIIASDQGSNIHEQSIAVAQLVGEALRISGYRGIFGLDFLLDYVGKLFVLEVNPRITGVTPLLTALYKGEAGVPFYLLHLLELGKYDYNIEDKSIDLEATGALLVVHSLENSTVIITSAPPSGTYKLHSGELELVSRSIDMTCLQPDEFIIQEYMPPHMPIKPGGRLVTVQFRQQILDEKNDELYNTTVTIISALRRKIKTDSI